MGNQLPITSPQKEHFKYEGSKSVSSSSSLTHKEQSKADDQEIAIENTANQEGIDSSYSGDSSSSSSSENELWQENIPLVKKSLHLNVVELAKVVENLQEKVRNVEWALEHQIKVNFELQLELKAKDEQIRALILRDNGSHSHSSLQASPSIQSLFSSHQQDQPGFLAKNTNDRESNVPEYINRIRSIGPKPFGQMEANAESEDFSRAGDTNRIRSRNNTEQGFTQEDTGTQS